MTDRAPIDLIMSTREVLIDKGEDGKTISGTGKWIPSTDIWRVCMSSKDNPEQFADLKLQVGGIQSALRIVERLDFDGGDL